MVYGKECIIFFHTFIELIGVLYKKIIKNYISKIYKSNLINSFISLIVYTSKYYCPHWNNIKNKYYDFKLKIKDYKNLYFLNM